MDKQAISAEIEKVLTAGASPYEPGPFIDPNSRLYLSLRSSKVKADPNSLDSLAQVLRHQPELQLFDGGVLLDGMGARRLEITSLAEWLVAQSLLTSPHEAVERLDRFVRQDFPPSSEILALTGITINTTVELQNGIKLVPFTDVPPSYSTDILTATPSFPPSWDIRQFLSPPTAALMASVEGVPRLAKDFPSLSAPDDVQLREDLMVRISYLLTLFGPSPVAPIMYWLHVDDSVPVAHWLQSWRSRLHEILPTKSKSVDISNYSSNIAEVVDRYLCLSSEHQRALEMPINRLNLAARRSSVVDAAVELRIALESLLLEQDEQLEVTYRLALRGALLGAPELEQRKQLFDTLKEVYNVCSKATHRGAFTEKIASKAPQLVNEGMSICADLIVRIIKRGSIPDWKEFALQGGNSGLPTSSTPSPT